MSGWEQSYFGFKDNILYYLTALITDEIMIIIKHAIIIAIYIMTDIKLSTRNDSRLSYPQQHVTAVVCCQEP